MGNKLGWVLAVVLAAALIGVIVYFLAFPSPTGPTWTRKAGMLDRHEITVDVAKVVGFTPSGSGNAADDYVKAAEIAERENKGAISDVNLAVMNRKGKPAKVDDRAVGILQEIADQVAFGAQKKECRLLFAHTPKAMDVHFEVLGVNRMNKVSDAMRILAEYRMSHQQYDQAAAALKNLLVMGRHLIDERSHIHVVRAGKACTREALDYLDSVYKAQGGKEAERKTLAEYRRSFLDFDGFYEDKFRKVWTAQSGGPSPGDIFNIVENDKDPAWRVQGILALGIVKFATREAKDKKYAIKLLDKLVSDPDEIIAMAAQAAKKLTLAQYRGLATKRLQEDQ